MADLGESATNDELGAIGCIGNTPATRKKCRTAYDWPAAATGSCSRPFAASMAVRQEGETRQDGWRGWRPMAPPAEGTMYALVREHLAHLGH
jgi:hypothetical protein